MLKKAAVFLIPAVLMLFSSCGGTDKPPSSAQAETVSETSAETNTETSEETNTQTSAKTSTDTSAEKKSDETAAAVKTEKSQETAPSSVNAETQTSAATSEIMTDTDICYDENVPNEFPEKSAFHIDKRSGKAFIIVSVTPKKIYWNDIEDCEAAVGQPLDIPVPAVFEDWFINADEMMIYMDSSSGTFGSVYFDGVEMKGMTYPQYWSADYLCPIAGGEVHFGEYTDEIADAFRRIDDGVYIEEANFYYKDNPFTDNMSVEALDMYFETLISDYEALMKKIADNPDTDYEIASFWGYQSGLRFRAEINSVN